MEAKTLPNEHVSAWLMAFDGHVAFAGACVAEPFGDDMRVEHIDKIVGIGLVHIDEVTPERGV